MSQAQPYELQHAINDILGKAIDENRSLTIKDRYRVDDLFDKLFNADKKQYYSYYSSYAAFSGNIDGLESCIRYFFVENKFKIDDHDLKRCIFSLNNAAYFDKIYDLLKDYDTRDFKDDEICRVFINSAVLNLEIQDAERALSENKERIKADNSKDIIRSGLVESLRNFYNNHEEDDILDFKNYIKELLKIHRKKIIPKVYQIAGPSILIPSFYSDEGQEFINISLNYVSDDVDFAIELEDVFYDSIAFSDYKTETINTISYSLKPISKADNISFGTNVVEIEII